MFPPRSAELETAVRRSLSQRIVNIALPLVLAYMALYAIWSIIRPFTGY